MNLTDLWLPLVKIFRDMFVENISKFGFDETVNKIGEAVTAAGWSLLHTHNLKETLQKKAFDVLPVTVLEVCKASLSVKLLERDKERAFSSLMPCRISVYNTSDGNTIISRLNALEISKQSGGVVEEVMGGAFIQMEEILDPFMIK